ncbi:MAG: hypothetical protein MZU91_14290 [Desulfosudis oleivorans]|nr:hypothetical protein [Desulfosudis oleivorans]
MNERNLLSGDTMIAVRGSYCRGRRGSVPHGAARVHRRLGHPHPARLFQGAYNELACHRRPHAGPQHGSGRGGGRFVREVQRATGKDVARHAHGYPLRHALRQSDLPGESSGVLCTCS